MIMTAAATIIFYVLAFSVGKWADIIVIKNGGRAQIALRVAMGGCIVLLLGMISCIAGALFSFPPMICIIVAALLNVAFAVAGYLAASKQGIGRAALFEKPSKCEFLLYLLILAIIVFEIISVRMYQSDMIAVYAQIPAATAIYETGRMIFSDPMMMLTGCVASVTGIHPLTVVFTLMPAPLILLYNLCYVAAAHTVCGRRGPVAVIFASLVTIWGYQSDALIPVTLLLSWFSTGVYIVVGVFGIAAVLLIIYLRGRPEKSEDNSEETEETDEQYREEWDMKKHRIINARNLAIALGIVTFVLIAAVFVLNNKINKLYDATVNLQSDLGSRCSVYEFIPDSGASEGYLLRASDGTLTFVGGGAAANADALKDFLEKYGSDVEKWYAYGQDEAENGAMRQLIKSGQVSVGRSFVIETKEITQ